MLELNVEGRVGAQTVENADIDKLHTEIIRLIRAWAWAQEPKRQRWADLHSRARTEAARELIARIRRELEGLEREQRPVVTSAAKKLARSSLMPSSGSSVICCAQDTDTDQL